jgi:hypothetical protein
MLSRGLKSTFFLLLSLALVLASQVRLNHFDFGSTSSEANIHNHAEHSHNEERSHKHSHHNEESDHEESHHHADDTSDDHKPFKHRHSPFEPEHEHDQPHQVVSTVVAIDHTTVSNISWSNSETSDVKHFIFYEDELYLSFLPAPLFRPPIQA